MKYLLLSLSFLLFVGTTQAQSQATTQKKCSSVESASVLSVAFDWFSDKAETTNCKAKSTNCAPATATVQKVASKTLDCNPANCIPANCKPENCPPGCKPGSPECKLASAVAEATPVKKQSELD